MKTQRMMVRMNTKRRRTTSRCSRGWSRHHPPEEARVEGEGSWWAEAQGVEAEGGSEEESQGQIIESLLSFAVCAACRPH